MLAIVVYCDKQTGGQDGGITWLARVQIRIRFRSFKQLENSRRQEEGRRGQRVSECFELSQGNSSFVGSVIATLLLLLSSGCEATNRRKVNGSRSGR